jgi:hypothetical protein
MISIGDKDTTFFIILKLRINQYFKEHFCLYFSVVLFLLYGY